MGVGRLLQDAAAAGDSPQKRSILDMISPGAGDKDYYKLLALDLCQGLRSIPVKPDLLSPTKKKSKRRRQERSAAFSLAQNFASDILEDVLSYNNRPTRSRVALLHICEEPHNKVMPLIGRKFISAPCCYTALHVFNHPLASCRNLLASILPPAATPVSSSFATSFRGVTSTPKRRTDCDPRIPNDIETRHVSSHSSSSSQPCEHYETPICSKTISRTRSSSKKSMCKNSCSSSSSPAESSRRNRRSLDVSKSKKSPKTCLKEQLVKIRRVCSRNNDQSFCSNIEDTLYVRTDYMSQGVAFRLGSDESGHSQSGVAENDHVTDDSQCPISDCRLPRRTQSGSLIRHPSYFSDSNVEDGPEAPRSGTKSSSSHTPSSVIIHSSPEKGSPETSTVNAAVSIECQTDLSFLNSLSSKRSSPVPADSNRLLTISNKVDRRISPSAPASLSNSPEKLANVSSGSECQFNPALKRQEEQVNEARMVLVDYRKGRKTDISPSIERTHQDACVLQ